MNIQPVVSNSSNNTVVYMLFINAALMLLTMTKEIEFEYW